MTARNNPTNIAFVDGDLIALGKSGVFDVIVHGCNCFHSFGGGIAAQIANQIPEAMLADQVTVQGDLTKMGTYTVATVQPKKNQFLTVVNAYTQYFPGPQEKFDYDNLADVLELIRKDFNGKRIGLPWIGCGIAGGDRSIVESIIRTVMHDQKVTIVEFIPPKEQA